MSDDREGLGAGWNPREKVVVQRNRRGRGSGPALFTNISSASTPAFRAAVLAGTDNVPIALLGDSTIRCTDETALPYNSQFRRSIAVQLAELLVASGRPAGANNLFGSGTTTIADLKLRDGRFDHGGAAVFGSVQCQGGASFSFPSLASFIKFTVDNPVTKFEIFWRDASLGRDFTWDVGGAPVAIQSTGVAQMFRTTVSAGAAALHPLTLNWSAGNVEIFGVNAYDDTAGRKEISIWNWGVNGATSATLIGNVGTPNGGRIQFFQSFPPKLAIVECGPNDWRTSVSVATFKANMLTEITALRAAGIDVWLLIPPFDGGSAGLTANQNAYVGALYELAWSVGVGLIDLRLIWLSYPNQVAQNFVGDFVHPTVEDGVPSIANLLLSAIQGALA